MSSTEFSLDDFLSAAPVGISSSEGSLFQTTDANDGTPWHEPGYEGEIDYRIRQLSYSSLLTLHSCPRKFQLQKLRTTHRTEEPLKSTITFAFGHVVGEGIALVLSGLPIPEVIFKMFMGWHTPSIFDSDDKLNKSLWSAILAVQKFAVLRNSILKDYELVYIDGKPACELSFCIIFPDGFRFRGHVDAVLRHRHTGEVLVLECKTTGNNTVSPATYKNSAQAIGYSVVLDHNFPDLSSYKVLYLVYSTKQSEFHALPFTKTFLQRALWIRELLLDIELIKLYASADIFPMHGESCMNFMRECEYFNTCTLSTANLTKPCTPAEEDKIDYQIVVSLADLLESQISRAENINVNTDSSLDDLPINHINVLEGEQLL